MPPSPGPVRLLAILSELLNKLGTRWYVFGAQAVNAYGRPRMSDDVDVTVELAGTAVLDFVRAMERAGFQVAIESEARDTDAPTRAEIDRFVAQTSVIPFVHDEVGMPLDVVLAGPGLEEIFLERRRELDLGGVICPVIAPEHLVVAKVLAGRPKDLEDVRNVLMMQRETIDLSEVRELLGQLEEALGQSDLVRALEAALASDRG